jgi:hypothetical protein
MVAGLSKCPWTVTCPLSVPRPLTNSRPHRYYYSGLLVLLVSYIKAPLQIFAPIFLYELRLFWSVSVVRLAKSNMVSLTSFAPSTLS